MLPRGFDTVDSSLRPAVQMSAETGYRGGQATLNGAKRRGTAPAPAQGTPF